MSGEKGISSIHANGFFGASTDGFHPRRKAESLSVLRDLVKGCGSCSTSYYYSPETVAVSLSIVLVEVYCFIIIITCL